MVDDWSDGGLCFERELQIIYLAAGGEDGLRIGPLPYSWSNCNSMLLGYRTRAMFLPNRSTFESSVLAFQTNN